MSWPKRICKPRSKAPHIVIQSVFSQLQRGYNIIEPLNESPNEITQQSGSKHLAKEKLKITNRLKEKLLTFFVTFSCTFIPAVVKNHVT